MKHYFITALFFSAASLFAQNIEIIDYNKEKKSDFQFLGGWNVKQSNNNFEIYGERIINNTNLISNDLIISAYFVPSDSKISINKLPNKLPEPIKIGKIEDNNSTTSHIKASFDKNQLLKLESGIYEVVLLLEDSKNKTIKNYHILDSPLIIDKNEVQIMQYKKDPHSQFNNSNNIVKDNNSNILLTGNWNLEIDFMESNIKINGLNNNILNNTNIKTNNLRLALYLAQESTSTNFREKGFEFLHVDLGEFKPNEALFNVTINTNITQLIPKGTYYPILMLLEENGNNGYIEKYAINKLPKINF